MYDTHDISATGYADEEIIVASRCLNKKASTDIFNVSHSIAAALEKTYHVIRTEGVAAFSPHVGRVVVAVPGVKKVGFSFILSVIIARRLILVKDDLCSCRNDKADRNDG
jgi:hypothetical protein